MSYYANAVEKANAILGSLLTIKHKIDAARDKLQELIQDRANVQDLLNKLAVDNDVLFYADSSTEANELLILSLVKNDAAAGKFVRFPKQYRRTLSDSIDRANKQHCGLLSVDLLVIRDELDFRINSQTNELKYLLEVATKELANCSATTEDVTNRSLNQE